MLSLARVPSFDGAWCSTIVWLSDMTENILAVRRPQRKVLELIPECRTGEEEWNGIGPVESNANEAHGK